MSEKLVAPEVRRQIGDLARRVGILERRIGGTGSGAAAGPVNTDLPFSYASALAVSESPPAKLRYNGFLTSIAVALGTAGSTDTTFDVKRNGTVIATVTLGSGVADLTVAIGVRVYAEDRLSVEITAAGTGAADMTATARFT